MKRAVSRRAAQSSDLRTVKLSFDSKTWIMFPSLDFLYDFILLDDEFDSDQPLIREQLVTLMKSNISSKQELKEDINDVEDTDNVNTIMEKQASMFVSMICEIYNGNSENLSATIPSIYALHQCLKSGWQPSHFPNELFHVMIKLLDSSDTCSINATKDFLLDSLKFDTSVSNKVLLSLLQKMKSSSNFDHHHYDILGKAIEIFILNSFHYTVRTTSLEELEKSKNQLSSKSNGINTLWAKNLKLGDSLEVQGENEGWVKGTVVRINILTDEISVEHKRKDNSLTGPITVTVFRRNSDQLRPLQKPVDRLLNPQRELLNTLPDQDVRRSKLPKVSALSMSLNQYDGANKILSLIYGAIGAFESGGDNSLGNSGISEREAVPKCPECQNSMIRLLIPMSGGSSSKSRPRCCSCQREVYTLSKQQPIFRDSLLPSGLQTPVPPGYSMRDPLLGPTSPRSGHYYRCVCDQSMCQLCGFLLMDQEQCNSSKVRTICLHSDSSLTEETTNCPVFLEPHSFSEEVGMISPGSSVDVIEGEEIDGFYCLANGRGFVMRQLDSGLRWVALPRDRYEMHGVNETVGPFFVPPSTFSLMSGVSIKTEKSESLLDDAVPSLKIPANSLEKGKEVLNRVKKVKNPLHLFAELLEAIIELDNLRKNKILERSSEKVANSNEQVYFTINTDSINSSQCNLLTIGLALLEKTTQNLPTNKFPVGLSETYSDDDDDLLVDLNLAEPVLFSPKSLTVLNTTPLKPTPQDISTDISKPSSSPVQYWENSMRLQSALPKETVAFFSFQWLMEEVVAVITQYAEELVRFGVRRALFLGKKRPEEEKQGIAQAFNESTEVAYKVLRCIASSDQFNILTPYFFRVFIVKGSLRAKFTALNYLESDMVMRIAKEAGSLRNVFAHLSTIEWAYQTVLSHPALHTSRTNSSFLQSVTVKLKNTIKMVAFRLFSNGLIERNRRVSALDTMSDHDLKAALRIHILDPVDRFTPATRDMRCLLREVCKYCTVESLGVLEGLWREVIADRVFQLCTLDDASSVVVQRRMLPDQSRVEIPHMSVEMVDRLISTLHHMRYVSRMEMSGTNLSCMSADLAFATAFRRLSKQVQLELTKALVVRISSLIDSFKSYAREPRWPQHIDDITDLIQVFFNQSSAEFQHFYELLLARRLLRNRFISLMTEKNVLEKLPAMSKSGLMIRDLDQTNAAMDHFRNFLIRKIDFLDLQLDPFSTALALSPKRLSVNVLTAHVWPSFWIAPLVYANLKLPTGLATIKDEFTQFFYSQDTNRFDTLNLNEMQKTFQVHGSEENQARINGIFQPTTEISDGWPIYEMQGNSSSILEYSGKTSSWQIKKRSDQGKNAGWAYCKTSLKVGPDKLDRPWFVWKKTAKKWITQNIKVTCMSLNSCMSLSSYSKDNSFHNGSAGFGVTGAASADSLIPHKPRTLRKLIWCHGAGTVSLKMRLSNAPIGTEIDLATVHPSDGKFEKDMMSSIDLVVTEPQVVILLCFNGPISSTPPSLSFQDLVNQTELTREELASILATLTRTELPILEIEYSSPRGHHLRSRSASVGLRSPAKSWLSGITVEEFSSSDVFRLSDAFLSGELGGGDENYPILASSLVSDHVSDEQQLMVAGVNSLYGWRNEVIDACVVRVLKEASKGRSGQFPNAFDQKDCAVPIDSLSYLVRSALAERCFVGAEDVMRRCEQLVANGMIDKVPGNKDTFRSVAYCYLSADEPSVTNDLLALDYKATKVTGQDLFDHLRIILDIQCLPTNVAGIPKSLFKTQFLSWVFKSSCQVGDVLGTKIEKYNSMNPFDIVARIVASLLQESEKQLNSLIYQFFCGVTEDESRSWPPEAFKQLQGVGDLHNMIQLMCPTFGDSYPAVHLFLGLNRVYFEHFPVELIQEVLNSFRGYLQEPAVDYLAESVDVASGNIEWRTGITPSPSKISLRGADIEPEAEIDSEEVTAAEPWTEERQEEREQAMRKLISRDVHLFWHRTVTVEKSELVSRFGFTEDLISSFRPAGSSKHTFKSRLNKDTPDWLGKLEQHGRSFEKAGSTGTLQDKTNEFSCKQKSGYPPRSPGSSFPESGGSPSGLTGIMQSYFNFGASADPLPQGSQRSPLPFSKASPYMQEQWLREDDLFHAEARAASKETSSSPARTLVDESHFFDEAIHLSFQQFVSAILITASRSNSHSLMVEQEDLTSLGDLLERFFFSGVVDFVAKLFSVDLNYEGTEEEEQAEEREPNPAAEQIDEPMIPCEFCTDSIRASLFEEHTIACQAGRLAQLNIGNRVAAGQDPRDGPLARDAGVLREVNDTINHILARHRIRTAAAATVEEHVRKPSSRPKRPRPSAESDLARSLLEQLLNCVAKCAAEYGSVGAPSESRSLLDPTIDPFERNIFEKDFTGLLEHSFLVLDRDADGFLTTADFSAAEPSYEELRDLVDPFLLYGRGQLHPSEKILTTQSSNHRCVTPDSEEMGEEELKLLSTPVALNKTDSLWVSVSLDVPLPTADSSTSYSGLTEAELELQVTVERVRLVVDESHSTTLALLIHYQWDVRSLVEEYVENSRAVRFAAGLGPKSRPSFLRYDFFGPSAVNTGLASGPTEYLQKSEESVPIAPEMCSICMDEVPQDDLYSLNCKHWYCGDCWRGFIGTAVGDRQVTFHCPHPQCRMRVSYDMISFFCDQGKRVEANINLIRSFIEDRRNRRIAGAYCKNPRGCAGVVLMADDAVDNQASCSLCGTAFCAACDFPPHTPSTCAMVASWEERGGYIETGREEDAEARKLKHLTTKPCPKCGVRIEKNGGCPHMTCVQPACKYQFCWECAGEYHTSSMCMRPKIKLEGNSILAFDEFDRQCANHFLARKVALKGKAESYRQLEQTKRPEDSAKWKVIAEGWSVLEEAQTILAHSCIVLFNVNSAKLSFLFESQKNLAQSLQQKFEETWTSAENLPLNEAKSAIRDLQLRLNGYLLSAHVEIIEDQKRKGGGKKSQTLSTNQAKKTELNTAPQLPIDSGIFQDHSLEVIQKKTFLSSTEIVSIRDTIFGEAFGSAAKSYRPLGVDESDQIFKRKTDEPTFFSRGLKQSSSPVAPTKPKTKSWFDLRVAPDEDVFSGSESGRVGFDFNEREEMVDDYRRTEINNLFVDDRMAEAMEESAGMLFQGMRDINLFGGSQDPEGEEDDHEDEEEEDDWTEDDAMEFNDSE